MVEVDGDCLFYLSRLDNQVKINGHRIELEEINTAIRSLLPNSEIHTVHVNRGFGDTLHVVVVTEEVFKSEFLIKKIGERLPKYMVPKSIHKVKQFPLNQSGKIDSNRLRETILNDI